VIDLVAVVLTLAGFLWRDVYLLSSAKTPHESGWAALARGPKFPMERLRLSIAGRSPPGVIPAGDRLALVLPDVCDDRAGFWVYGHTRSWVGFCILRWPWAGPISWMRR